AVSYDRMVPPKTLEEYRGWLARQVEIINHAIKGLPREKIRYHVCWGSWPGPHSSDVPFKDIADLVLQVRAGGYSIELANPRHAAVGASQAAQGYCAHPRRDQPSDQHRGAPGTGRRTHRSAGAARRAGECHRQHGLRIRAGDVFRARASANHVGEARGTGRWRAACEQGAME